MFSQRLPLVPASRGVPPPWAARIVWCCAFGIVALPLAAPLLLAAGGTAGPAGDLFRRVGFYVALSLWLGLFATAQYLTAAYRPVPGRR